MCTLCVLQMDEFSVSERVALQLAGLQARVVLGPYEEGKESRYITMVTTTCIVCKYMFVNFPEKTNRRTHNVLIVMHPEIYFFPSSVLIPHSQVFFGSLTLHLAFLQYGLF